VSAPRLRKPAALRAQLRSPEARATLLAAAPQLPPDCADWLGNLSLLTGLPFETIAADPRMLPTESIRFFYVDPNWTAAAVDGALSIANLTDQNTQTLQLLAPQVKRQVHGAAATLRQRRGKIRRGQSALAVPELDAPVNQSGFLLRSVVITDFPTLQVAAWADTAGTQSLPIVRLELLSPGLMIAIFAGQAARFDLIKPSHLLHFGVEDPTTPGGAFPVELRGIGGALPAGVSVPPDTPSVPLPLRPDPAGRRVVDVNALQGALSTALGNAYRQAGGTMPAFQSAAFALQMIAAAEVQSFVSPSTIGAADHSLPEVRRGR
jgi:hypothetical protein